MILGTDANQVLLKALITMRLLDPNATSNPDAVKAAIERWQPITGDDLVKIINDNYADQIQAEASYIPLFRLGLWNNETDEPVTLQESITSNLNWLFLLRRTIAQQKYPLVLLDIVGSSTPDNRGMLVPAGRGARHWLVVTGLTSWSQWMQGTQYHWVRVANPFENETEYYPWDTFIGSIENLPPNLVTVSKK